MQSSFQDDWDAAQREVFGMPDLPMKPKQSARKKPAQARHVRLIVEPPIQSGQGTHSNSLKKVRSVNAKEQPRTRGKFGRKSGFFSRLFGARRRVNASIRAEQRQNAAAGRATIPMQRKPRRRQVRSETVQPQVSYRKSVIRQILGL